MHLKRFLAIIFLASLPFSILGQQRPQFTQYMLNNILLNPAIAGAYDYTDLRVGFRNQWTGLDGAPQTFFLSGHGLLNKKPDTIKRSPHPTIGTINYFDTRVAKKSFLQKVRHGLGGYLVYDEAAVLSRIMFYGIYAIHVPITDRVKASLGIQGGFQQYRQDNDELNPLNPDPAVGTGVSTSFEPDLGIGVWVYTDNFYAGFSTVQLLQNELSFSDVAVDPQNSLFLHYYLTGGYRFQNVFGSPNWQFIPSATVKFLEGDRTSYDLNARLVWARANQGISDLWFGLSGRYRDAIAGLFGLSVNRWLNFSYSYDYSLTEIRRYNSGTHEISIGLKIPRAGQENYEHNLF